MHKKIWFILFFLFANFSYAQEQNSVLIQGINVTGLKTLSKKSFLDLLPFRTGEAFEKPMLTKSLQMLFRSSDFLDATVSYKKLENGNIMIFYSVQERPWINAISFQGNDAISNSTLKKKLASSEHDFLNVDNLKQDIQSIIQAYQIEGFIGTHVETEQKKQPNGLEIIFKISEGSKLSISKINVYGSIALNPDYLKSNFMTLKEPFFFNIIKYPLIPQVFTEEKAKMSELAYDKGFMDFQIVKTEVIVHISYQVIDDYIKKQLRDLGFSRTDINKYSTQIQAIFQQINDKPVYSLLDDIKNNGNTNYRLDQSNKNSDFSLFLKDLEIDIFSLLHVQDTIGKNLPSDTIFKVQYDKRGSLGYDVNFYVNEGKPFVFTGVSIKGSAQVDAESLKSQYLTLPVGSTYNYSALQSFKQSMEQFFRDKGYFGVVIQDTPIKNTIRQTISHQYIVQEGQKMHINRMYITGVQKTKPFVVDRELRIKEGDVFNQSKIMVSQRLLQRTGYFKNIDIIPSPGPEENLLDLTWKMQEQSTGSLQLGGGYGTETGVSVFGSVNESNFLGYGLNTAAKISFGQYERGFQFSVSSNYIHYLPVGWSISTGYDWMRQNASPRYDRNHDGKWDKIVQKSDGKYYYMEQGDPGFSSYYDENRTGNYDVSGSPTDPLNYVPDKNDDIYSTQRYFDRQILFLDLGVGYSFSDFWTVSVMHSTLLSKYANAHNIDIDNLWVNQYYSLKRDLTSHAWTYSSHVDLGLEFNNTDSPLSPTTGIQNKYTIGFYGIEGGFDRFLKLDASISGYVPCLTLPLSDFKIVWATGARISYLNHLFGPMRLHYENQIGFNTMEEVRGWADYIDDSDFLGLSKISFGTEMRMSVPYTNSLLWFVAFFDAGNVSETPQRLPLNFNDYLYSVGVGLRLDFPSFPVRFYLAQRLRWNQVFFKRDGSLTFQFSISSAF